MNFTTLGKTNLTISQLGLGGIPIQRVDASATKKLINEMLKYNLNYIDTARGYTVSEEYLGEALEGVREHFILATKSMARSKEQMEKDIDISLSNLRTNYIDLYQVHNPNLKQLEEVMAEHGALEALIEAKKEGKIRHIGLTAHTLDVFEKAVELDWVETIMFPYNIVERQGEALIQKCKERNIGFIVMKPMAGGAIENPDLALRFICSNPNISVVIPGMYDVKELKQNLMAVENNKAFSQEELTEMDAIRDSLGNSFCRRCNYCQPCSAGINISGIFILQGYLDRYGLGDWAQSRYDAFPVKASACINCGLCESRCPYELPIRNMLKEAAEKFESNPSA